MKDRYALVTGASSGIGKDIAYQLAQRGWSLILVARRHQLMQKIAEEIKQNFEVSVEVISQDLSNPEGIKNLIEQIERRDHKIQILINNAGIGLYRDLIETPMDQLSNLIQLNIHCVSSLTRSLLGQMMQTPEPCYILNVASIAGYVTIPGFVSYCASKHFVRSFSLGLSVELAKSNVKVSCLCPGGTWTEFMEKSKQDVTSVGKLMMMDSKKVAAIGLDGMFKGKSAIIPGISNQAMVTLIRILPEMVGIKIAKIMMGQSVRKMN